jgi:transposase
MASHKNKTKKQLPNPEIEPKANRRHFSAAEKLRILQEADECTEPGQVGALLRREGLYSSHLSNWRQLRDDGQLQALTPRQRGPKPTLDPQAQELARLKKENARLQARLAQAEMIIDVQKKVAQLLGELPKPKTQDE